MHTHTHTRTHILHRLGRDLLHEITDSNQGPSQLQATILKRPLSMAFCSKSARKLTFQNVSCSMVKMSTAQFTVKHYAANVTYDAQVICMDVCVCVCVCVCACVYIYAYIHV